MNKHQQNQYNLFFVEIHLLVLVQKNGKNAMGENFYLWSLKGRFHRAQLNTQHINREISRPEYQQLHYLL